MESLTLAAARIELVWIKERPPNKEPLYLLKVHFASTTSGKMKACLWTKACSPSAFDGLNCTQVPRSSDRQLCASYSSLFLHKHQGKNNPLPQTQYYIWDITERTHVLWSYGKQRTRAMFLLCRSVKTCRVWFWTSVCSDWSAVRPVIHWKPAELLPECDGRQPLTEHDYLYLCIKQMLLLHLRCTFHQRSLGIEPMTVLYCLSYRNADTHFNI